MNPEEASPDLPSDGAGPRDAPEASGASSDGTSRGASDQSLDRLREVLDTTCSWPGEYTFKFVVPRDSANHLIALIGDLPYSERPSRTGKFLAVTVCARMDSSAAVIDLYRRAAAVKGLLSF